MVGNIGRYKKGSTTKALHLSTKRRKNRGQNLRNYQKSKSEEKNGVSAPGTSSAVPKKEKEKNKIPRIKKKTYENVPPRRNPLRNPPPVDRWTPTHEKRNLTSVVSDSNPGIRDEVEPLTDINCLQIKVEVDDDETILKQLPDLGIIQKDSADATGSASCISSLSHQLPDLNTDEKNILNMADMLSYSNGQSSAETFLNKTCAVTSVSLSQHLPKTSPVPCANRSQHLPKKSTFPCLSQHLSKTSTIPPVSLSQHSPNLNILRKKPPNKTHKVLHNLQPRTVISNCADTLPATVTYNSPVVIQSDLPMPTPTYTSLPQTISYNLPLQSQTLVLPPTAQNVISPASSQFQILPAPIQIMPTPTYFSPIFLSNNQNSTSLICTETNSVTSTCYACGKVTGNVQLKDTGTDPVVDRYGVSTFLDFVTSELESIKDPKLQLLAQTEIASIIDKIKARDKESLEASCTSNQQKTINNKDKQNNKDFFTYGVSNPSKESLKAVSSSNQPKLINTLGELNNKDSFIYGASNASKESLQTIYTSDQPKLINTLDKLNNKDSFICGASNVSKESLQTIYTSDQPKLISSMDRLNNKDSFVCGASNASKESLQTIYTSDQPKLILTDKLNKDSIICDVSNLSLEKKSNTVVDNEKSLECATYPNQRNSLEESEMQTSKEPIIENVSNPSLANLPNTTVTKRNYGFSNCSPSNHEQGNILNEKRSKLSLECTGQTNIVKESDMQVTNEHTFASSVSNINIINTSEIAMQGIGNSSKNDSDLNQTNVSNKVGNNSSTNSSITDFSNWMEGLINKNENAGLKNSLENIVSNSRQGRRLSYIDIKARKGV